MVKLFFYALLILFVSGCANTSKFVKAPLTAYGTKGTDGNETVRYFMLGIDLKKYPEEPLPPFQVELSPGSIPIQSLELTVEKTAMYLPPFVPPPQWPEHWKEEARKDRSFEGNGIYISFREGKLIYFGICTNCGGKHFTPRIGDADGNALYPMPLTLEQISDIFGPPDRLYNVNEIRY